MEFKDFPLKIKSVNEAGIFEGYASLFIKEPDAHNDLVAKNAFLKTLAQGGRNRTGIACLWQHKSDAIPGVWLNLQEDSVGLAVRGKLALEIELARDIHAIMKLGQETGTFKLSLSIGFDSIEESFHIDQTTKKRIRTLKEVSIWEISIVTFPARLGSTIGNVKAALTVRSLESQLRNLGLSKSAAQYTISLCRDSINGKTATVKNSDWNDILSSLKKTNEEARL